ncbi:MAG TPA: HDIG domain-containing protein [Phycisphaerales bacterium]|nr:HDIG domain-containing protein [Phycisphaerales bacterium]
MNLDQARTLMHEWVQSPALRIHMETVAACMGRYAKQLEPAYEEQWRIAGLLHDFDYERHPTAEEHPKVGVAHLATLGVDESIMNAIRGHASERTGYIRATPMDKALFACDELAGFIVACAKVRPDGLATLEPKSVKKKLKDKAFAAAVSREDIALGVSELGPLANVTDEQHIQNCIEAIREVPIK